MLGDDNKKTRWQAEYFREMVNQYEPTLIEDTENETYLPLALGYSVWC